MTDNPKDVAGQFASGGQSSGSAYPNAAHRSGNFRGGQSLRGYHGSAQGGTDNAAESSANPSPDDRRADMADYDRYGRDDRSRSRMPQDREYRGAGYAGRNWAERTGDEIASWAGDRDAEYRRERDRDRLGRYPGEEAGERRYGEDDSRQRYSATGSGSSSSRYGSGRHDRDDDRTVPGSGYQGRNWAERAGDEVQSWVGDRDAEYRREQDRQRLGRYPGEDAGERMTGSGRSGYDSRYASDRDGYRGAEGRGGYGGQTAYGSYGGGGGQTAYGNPGSPGGQDRFGGSGGHGGADHQTSQSDFRTGRSGYEASRGHASADPTLTYSQSSTGGRSERQYPQAMLSEGQDDGTEDRGFFTRAADEVASWFGDEEAERRRQMDQMREETSDSFDGTEGRRSSADPTFAGATGFSSAGASRQAHDPYYANYRSQRAAELDEDFRSYDEERRSRFETDFSSWRSKRKQGGGALEGSGMSGNALASQVREHAMVEGSDGKTVGTVDRVMGGDIKLAKKDSPDGKHHLIPMSWVAAVDGDRVRLTKTADDAKAEWRDAEGAASA